jgi:hypothetical protein
MPDNEPQNLEASTVLAPVQSLSIKIRADQSGLDGEAVIDFSKLNDPDALVVTFAGVAAEAAFGDPAAGLATGSSCARSDMYPVAT